MIPGGGGEKSSSSSHFTINGAPTLSKSSRPGCSHSLGNNLLNTQDTLGCFQELMINDVRFYVGKAGVGAGRGQVTWAPSHPTPIPRTEERVLPPQLRAPLPRRERVIGSAWRGAGLCPHRRKEFGGSSRVRLPADARPPQTCSQLGACRDSGPLPLTKSCLSHCGGSPARLSFSRRTQRKVLGGGRRRDWTGRAGKRSARPSAGLAGRAPSAWVYGPTLAPLDASRRAGHLDAGKRQAHPWAEAVFSSGGAWAAIFRPRDASFPSVFLGWVLPSHSFPGTWGSHQPRTPEPTSLLRRVP